MHRLDGDAKAVSPPDELQRPVWSTCHAAPRTTGLIRSEATSGTSAGLTPVSPAATRFSTSFCAGESIPAGLDDSGVRL